MKRVDNHHNYILSKTPPGWAISSFLSTIKGNYCINLYAFLPFKAMGTLINLTTCYCQVEHIHLLFKVYTRQSLQRSIPSGLISSHLRRVFPACLYLVRLSTAEVESSFSHSCCQTFFNMPAPFPIHKMSGLPSLHTAFIYMVKCYYRLNHFPSEELTLHIFFF